MISTAPSTRKTRQFEATLWLPQTPPELFPFFAQPANLNKLTPPWLHFQILTPMPFVMRTGAVLDYRLRLHSIPLRWQTRIQVWDPPHRFVDEQIRGPYRQWIHEHKFEARDGGTLMRDQVRYSLLLDFMMHRFVRSDIERIFEFRSTVLRRLFFPNSGKA